MKKSIIVLTFICLMNNIQSQEAPKKSIKNMTNIELNQYYKKKSKSQINGGWTLLGLGIVINSISIISVTQNLDEAADAGVGVIIGTASMIGSIPLFISGSKNKKRANISLTQEKITMGHKINQQSNYNSIALSIRLGK